MSYTPIQTTYFGLSKEDWTLLCELAAENKLAVVSYGDKLLAEKLREIRDEIRYADELQHELDVAAEFMEKSVEEALS